MFKKIEEVGNMVQMDKSAIRSTRKGLAKCLPELEVYLDDLVPKKAKYHIMRLKDNNKADLIIKDNEIVCLKFKKAYLNFSYASYNVGYKSTFYSHKSLCTQIYCLQIICILHVRILCRVIFAVNYYMCINKI